jgi:hypothetical protein
MKRTAAIRSVGQAVDWNEALGMFAADPFSHIRLCLYAKRSVGKDIFAGMLEIPFDSFHTSQSKSEIPFVLRNTGVAQQPTIYLKINVSVDSATDNSDSGPQEGPQGSGIVTSLTGEGQMLSTERALDDADQAVDSMKPALGIEITIANDITTASNVIDSVVSVYKTWEQAVATIKAVLVVVDKIAEVHPYAKMAWSILSVIPKV